jgi:hypothetical protein
MDQLDRDIERVVGQIEDAARMRRLAEVVGRREDMFPMPSEEDYADLMELRRERAAHLTQHLMALGVERKRLLSERRALRAAARQRGA